MVANKLKKYHKKPLLIYSIICLLILLNFFGNFLIYRQYVKKPIRIVPAENEKIVELERKLEEIKRQQAVDQERAAQLEAEQAAAKKARLQAQTRNGLIQGSSTILNACWTKTELAGSLQDKKVQRPIKNPFRGHPDIYVPTHANSPVKSKLRNSIRRVIPRNNEKIVALTFDLCERTKEITGYDAEIVNYLRKHKIPATFYAGGKWMHSHPDKAKQLMADHLFEIGNHAWTHGNLRILKGEDMENQILWTQGQYEVLRNQLIADIEMNKCNLSITHKQKEINRIPPVPLTFRFPYGTCSAESLNFLAKSGLPAVQWDVVTADPWRKQTAKGIARTVLRKVKPGSIIIAHANGRGYRTAESLDLFIPKLKKKGYRFVTVSELLKSGEVVSTESCYELRRGDNKRYDRIFGEGTE